MDHLKLSVDVLSVEEISNLVYDATCGAVSIFVGTTRDNFDGKKVVRLEYEAYESMALKALKSICDGIRSKWKTVHGIAIYHRLGVVPVKESSVVIAISSPHRQESLEAVAHCIEALKSNVPIWKKEVYDGEETAWKENKECRKNIPVDKALVQITVSNQELQQRISNFMERKREQVNLSNIQDFIGDKSESTETSARVRAMFVKRSDSKGHLKVHRVYNEWGPQTARSAVQVKTEDESLPPSIAERVVTAEKFLSITSVERDVYKRLKEMEDKIHALQSVSPEYAQFWNKHGCTNCKQDKKMEFVYTADDISRKIEQLERQDRIS